MRKAQTSAKSGNKSKAALREAEREVHKMRKDLLEMRDQNKQLQMRIQDLKEQQVTVRHPAQSRSTHLKENSQQSTVTQ
jgi:cell division protein FtsB